MRIIRSGFFLLIVIFIAATSLTAHDLWLVPQKFMISPGDTLTISANTGMDFPKSLSAITPDRIHQFFLIGRSIKENITELKVEGNSLVANYTIEKPGTYVIGMALKTREIKLTAEEFNDYLLHDGLPGIYELRKQEGILDKSAVEHYSKYAKTIVQAGKTFEKTALQPLGFPIEIIPKINPYSLKVGDELKALVLFKGKPLPKAEIAWSYPGKGEEFAGSTKTDAEGLASIPLINMGPYVIRITHMEWVKKETHEWESYWASLTFKVLSH